MSITIPSQLEMMTERATRYESEGAALRTQLEICAKTFSRYAALHRAKGTPEADTKAQQNATFANECYAVLDTTAVGVNLLREMEKLQIEVKVLQDIVNTPLFDDFTEAVKREAAHQVQRWGRAHDRSKSAENWFWLVGYLSGKALRSAITGDREKALHHTISSAAALMQWHAAILWDKTSSGLGSDEDLKAKESA